MFDFKVSIDDSKLKELQRKLKELNGEREVSLTELLPDSFINKYTEFQTLQDMLKEASAEYYKRKLGL